jgi:hypothetical protein
MHRTPLALVRRAVRFPRRAAFAIGAAATLMVAGCQASPTAPKSPRLHTDAVAGHDSTTPPTDSTSGVYIIPWS